ncbi:DUF2889 domain-containing protein [Hydrogenophaga sp. NFH-34]|uniref:DUF2889 domain-containing protein n=1 Tax=Hydrogenophaga sp. NFH-34 TaxID=2744446 RepID=UPI001F2E352E|nr:DUF2889 domain-containing protein [Hydrogenophaga sp. NFH-34]
MPLPPPDCPREPSQQRQIRIEGFRRADGLWDVEGHLLDTLPHDVQVGGGLRRAGEPMHAMALRLTVDLQASIRAAVAVSDAHPFAGVCGRITPAYEQLVGLRVGPGFRRQVRALFPPSAGCTHLSELVLALGTGVLQTLATALHRDPAVKPFSLDGCHALMTDGPVVRQFHPRWYRGVDALPPAA